MAGLEEDIILDFCLMTLINNIHPLTMEDSPNNPTHPMVPTVALEPIYLLQWPMIAWPTIVNKVTPAMVQDIPNTKYIPLPGLPTLFHRIPINPTILIQIWGLLQRGHPLAVHRYRVE